MILTSLLYSRLDAKGQKGRRIIDEYNKSSSKTKPLRRNNTVEEDVSVALAMFMQRGFIKGSAYDVFQKLLYEKADEDSQKYFIENVAECVYAESQFATTRSTSPSFKSPSTSRSQTPTPPTSENLSLGLVLINKDMKVHCLAERLDYESMLELITSALRFHCAPPGEFNRIEESLCMKDYGPTLHDEDYVYMRFDFKGPSTLLDSGKTKLQLRQSLPHCTFAVGMLKSIDDLGGFSEFRM